MKEPTMALQSPYVRETKNESLSLDPIFCSETKQHYLAGQFRHGSVFKKSTTIFWEILL